MFGLRQCQPRSLFLMQFHDVVWLEKGSLAARHLNAVARQRVSTSFDRARSPHRLTRSSSCSASRASRAGSSARVARARRTCVARRGILHAASTRLVVIGCRDVKTAWLQSRHCDTDRRHLFAFDRDIGSHIMVVHIIGQGLARMGSCTCGHGHDGEGCGLAMCYGANGLD